MSQLIGSYLFTVSSKGRFSIPAALRQRLAASADNTFVVVFGADRCLDAYPMDEWIRRMKVLRSIPNKKLGRYYKRLVLGNAIQVKMDAHNRILIPPDILHSVGIFEQVRILGQADHLELWRPETHEAYMEKNKVPIEDVLEVIEDQLPDSD